MTKKKYLDKKNALHFRLVQRSVRDGQNNPNNNNNVSERIFAPLNEAAAEKLDELNGTIPQDPSLEDDLCSESLEDLNFENLRLEEQPYCPGDAAKFGIFYDDRSYDYTKHLKRIGEAPDAVYVSANNPSDDLYNKSNDDYDNDFPDHDIDSGDPSDYDVKEVMDALDDDAYVDENLDDDFIVKLNREEETAVLAPSLNYEDDLSDSQSDNLSFKGKTYAASLAMTSIDNQFDRLMRVYDDEQDDLSITGSDEEGNDIPDLDDAINDFIINQHNYIRPAIDERKQAAVTILDEIRKEMGPVPLKVLDREVSDTNDEDTFSSESDSDPHYDCQSIAITFTNSDNLPEVIKEAPYKSSFSALRMSRQGRPITVDGSESYKSSVSFAEPEVVKTNRGSARKKDETAEEKKLRKTTIKAERKENRAHKKNLKVKFKLGDVQ